MPEPKVSCPKCGHRFPLTKALTGQIEESLRGEYEALARQKEREIEARYKQEKRELQDELQRQANAKAKKATSSELASLRAELTQRKREAKAESAKLGRKLAATEARVQREARREAKEHYSAELARVQTEVQMTQTRRLELERREREFGQRETGLNARQARMQAEVENARKQASAQASKQLEDQYLQSQLEHEKTIFDLKRQLTDARRRLDQSSQQLQGEVRELQLEKALAVACPEDKVRAVRKGKLGADIVQKVQNTSGRHCGTIVWEAKNTRAWNKSWVAKLRRDQRKEKAEVAVLVSTALPKNVKSHITQISGVWVCDFSVAAGLAIILRANLVELARLRASTRGKPEKMEILYQYMMSTELRQRVEAIVEAFVGMRDDLEREKSVTERAWAARGRNLDQVLENIAGMVGDIQAIAPTFPKIRRLELPAPR